MTQIQDARTQQMIEDEQTFIALFEQEESKLRRVEGEIVEGTILTVGKEFAIIDIGYKSEGRVSTSEFQDPEGGLTIKPGDVVEVYVDRAENDDGLVEVSKEKADRLKIWDEIAEACENEELVEGVITGRVKGGLTVDIGVKAFLPASQVDLRPVRNLEKFIGQRFHFKVIKFNKKRGNIVLSRRALLEKQREALKSQTLSKLEPGMLIDGVVKNITDYGAFIDLGGIDGLLHVSDMSWARNKDPKEMFDIGDDVRVKVLRYDPERERVSLGLKQITEDPWKTVHQRYHIGQRVSGAVVSMTDYGSFIELEEGVEGMVHISEMSWTKRIKHPSKVMSVGDEVESVILEIDLEGKRISLGMKQLERNPWDILAEKHPIGSEVEGEIRNITNFGVFIDIGGDIDGLCHVTDLSWSNKVRNPTDHFEKGEKVKAKVLAIEPERERFSLGIKQLTDDPWMSIHSKFARGSVHEGTINKLLDFGAIVELDEFIEGFLHISEIAEEKIASIHDVLEEGKAVKVKVISIIPEERKLGLSIRRVDIDEDPSAYNVAPEAATTLGDLIRSKIDVSEFRDANSGDDDAAEAKADDAVEAKADDDAVEAKADDDAVEAKADDDAVEAKADDADTGADAAEKTEG